MRLAEYKPSISDVLSNCGADIPDDGDGWVSIACPFHDDSHNSATYNETEGVFKCSGRFRWRCLTYLIRCELHGSFFQASG